MRVRKVIVREVAMSPIDEVVGWLEHLVGWNTWLEAEASWLVGTLGLVGGLTIHA